MFTVSLFVSSSLCGLKLIGHDRYRSADLCHGRIGDFVLDKVSLLSPSHCKLKSPEIEPSLNNDPSLILVAHVSRPRIRRIRSFR